MIDDAKIRALGLSAGIVERVTADISARDAFDNRRSCVECQRLKRIDLCSSRTQKPMFLLQRCPDFLELK